MSKKIILGILVVVALASCILGVSYFKNKSVEKNLEIENNVETEVLSTPEIEVLEEPIEETVANPTK